jgi:DNA-directed RNA polymerase subunit F
MLFVNKKLIDQARQYLVLGGRSKALDLLMSNGCDFKSASDIIRHLAEGEHATDFFISQHLQTLLPEQQEKAVETLADYFDLREEHAQRLVQKMLAKPLVSEQEIGQVLQELKPRRRSDTQPKMGEASSYQNKLLKLLTEGKQQQCTDLLVKELQMDPDTAVEYLEDFKNSIFRND